MGCVGGREKNKDDNNLFIKLISSGELNLQGVDQNNLKLVRYIRLLVEDEEVETEDIQNLEKMEEEAIVRLTNNNNNDNKRQRVNIELREKENGGNVDRCLASGVLDCTYQVNNPGKWFNHFVELLNGSGSPLILGALRVQCCFYSRYPGNEQVGQQLQQLPGDKQYVLRQIKYLLANHQLNTIDWPQRKGQLQLKLLGLKLNGLHKLKGDFNFWGKLTLLGHTVQLDDLQAVVLQKGIDLDLAVTFDPLSPVAKAQLQLFYGDKKEREAMGVFSVDLEDTLKKHGQWSQKTTVKAKEAPVEPEMMPVLQVMGLFKYNCHVYGELPQPPAINLNNNKDQEMSRGVLLVHVQRARGLLGCDQTGLSDPFVEFYPSHNTNDIHCTQVIQSNLNPVWGAKRKINLKLPKDQILNQTLHVVVWDSDPCGQDLIGKVDIDITQLVKTSKWIDGWQKMSNEQMKGQAVGDIYLQIGYKAKGATNMPNKPTPKY